MSDFLCHVREGLDEPTREAWREACKNLDFYAEFEGDRYCVLHFPAENKDDFEEAKQRKIAQKDYDFRGAVFPKGTSNFTGREFDGDVDFSWATFVGEAIFAQAQFSGENTRFRRAQFSDEGTDLTRATTDFTGAHFNGKLTDFAGAHFNGKWTEFTGVTFGCADTIFRLATFANDASFSRATFKETVLFAGSKENPMLGSRAWLVFGGSQIEQPQRFTFHTVVLHPGWFINADMRNVDFTNVQWYGISGGPKGALDMEIDTLQYKGFESPHALLAQACRRLSANAEENREYPLANEFHYWSMDAIRKGDWRFYKDLTWRDLLNRESWPAFVKHFSLITTLYWALSGYGVRAVRAFWVLVGMCALFAVLYILLGPTELQNVGQAVVYSLGAAARLNPEPKPNEPGLFQFLVIAEGLLGPLQIALLALAVRRKVMR